MATKNLEKWKVRRYSEMKIFCPFSLVLYGTDISTALSKDLTTTHKRTQRFRKAKHCSLDFFPFKKEIKQLYMNINCKVVIVMSCKSCMHQQLLHNHILRYTLKLSCCHGNCHIKYIFSIQVPKNQAFLLSLILF